MDLSIVELLKTIILGIVEGLTEWLPVSSTGHMILVDEFIKLGYKVVTGGTDNHVFLLDLSEFPFSGRDLQERCDENGITLNKNAIPNDQRSPMQTSGVRIGTAPMTTRGYKEDDFREVARRIDKIVKELAKEKEAEAK